MPSSLLFLCFAARGGNREHLVQGLPAPSGQCAFLQVCVCVLCVDGGKRDALKGSVEQHEEWFGQVAAGRLLVSIGGDGSCPGSHYFSLIRSFFRALTAVFTLQVPQRRGAVCAVRSAPTAAVPRPLWGDARGHTRASMIMRAWAPARVVGLSSGLQWYAAGAVGCCPRK